MFSLRSAAMSSDRGVELVGEIYGSSACVRVCVCGRACVSAFAHYTCIASLYAPL